MKKIGLILCFLFGVLLYGSAQCGELTQIEKGLFKKKVYKLCNIELSDVQFVTLFKDNEQFKDLYKPMATNYFVYFITYTFGTALILYPLIESLYDSGDPNWNWAYVGAGLVAVSIPFKIKYQKQARSAADAYNKSYRETSALSCNFKISTSGVGLVMRF